MIRYVLMAATAVLLVGCTTTGTTVNTDSGESYELRRSGNSFVVDVPSTIQDTHLAILRGFRDLRITPIMHNRCGLRALRSRVRRRHAILSAPVADRPAQRPSQDTCRHARRPASR